MATLYQICDSVTSTCAYVDAETLISSLNADLSENGAALVTANNLSDFSGMLSSLATIEPSTVALITGFYVAFFIMGVGAKLTVNVMKRA